MKAPVTTLTRLAPAAVAALLSLALQACGSADTGTAAGQGAVGEPCFPNATCNAGLSCNAGQCEAVAQAEGEAGGPCYPNATCNAGLDCAAGRCVDPTIPRGELGGPCYPNATCNAGYDCVGGLCAEPSTTDAGGDGSGADTGTAADADAGDAPGDTIDDTTTDTGPPPLCGNEVVESGEECDEDAPASFDCVYGETACSFCDVDCRLVLGAIHLCGDAVLDAEEVCDPGPSGASAECGDDCNCAPGYHLESGSCLTDIRPCELPNATASEQVWDPSLGAFGRCEASRCNTGYSRLNGDCIAVGCGNGVLEPGEACDDGNLIREDGCTSYCEEAACGDGIVWAGVEACDDGNRETEVCGYGLIACSVCNGSCARQPGATSFCGDGIIDAGEVCDDANASDTDGCNRGCLCGAGFHPEAGDCALDIRPCTIENAEAAEETWSGSGYGPCLLVACNADFHATLNACEPDEIACEAPNAEAAVQRWDGLAYGDCTVLSCVAEHHLEAGACLPDIRDCSLANATVATQPWLPATSSYGACEASTCAAGYRLQFGTCVAGYVQVDAGEQHACAVTAEGSVHCWGRNVEGQLGDGTTTSRVRPVRVVGVTDAVEVAAGGAQTCARLRSGTVKCWGRNSFGVGSTTVQATPIEIPSIRNVTQISVGGNINTWDLACAVTTDGRVYCWGDNNFGQLGFVTGSGPVWPTAVPGVVGVSHLATGKNHACAILMDGTSICWGNSELGQAGDNTTVEPPTFTRSIITAQNVTTGEGHTCFLLAEGTVKCMGIGYALGDGYNVQRTYPVATLGIEGATSLGAGIAHTCVVTSAGGTPTVVKCWGANGGGALGNGTISTPSYSPVDVVGLSNAIQVTGGGFSSCALLRDASISCWGYNDYGQLGDGTTTVRTTPVPLQVPSVCGDGLVGPSEVCAGGLLSGRTCESFGFGGGAMACRADCSGFDTYACRSEPVCGDGIISGSEVCDGTELNGLTCDDFGYAFGALACSGDCASFNTANCADAVCGDGVRTGTEECDGSDFGGATCNTQGYLLGNLACSASCRLNTGLCSGVASSVCNLSAATRLTTLAPLSGSLSTTDPQDGLQAGAYFDLFRMSLAAWTTVTIEMSSTAVPSLDTFLYLLRADTCAQLAYDDDGAATANDSMLTFTVAEPGEYIVVATSYQAGATGPYIIGATVR